MMLDHRVPVFKQLRSGLSVVAAPVQYVVDWPTHLLTRVADNFTSQQALIEENARLKVEKILLLAQLQTLMALEKENAQLRDLDEAGKKTNQKILIARILAVDSAPYIHEVVLDRGSSQGVYVGQPVLNATGLMGQIVAVGPLTSRLMLLSDSRSAIPVEIERNSVRSMVVGTGDANNVYLNYVPETTDVQVGDKLLTSGLGLRYPPGYPVGTIVQVIHNGGDSFLTIQIKPAADLEQSRLVILLWPKQELLSKMVKQQLSSVKKEVTQMRQIAEGSGVNES